MANIVSLNDFVGELTIAQLDQANVAAVLQTFIDKYETEYLNKMLGVALKKEVVAGAATDPYKTLIDGGEFTNSQGVLMEFAGIKKAIACYVYYFYTIDNTTFTTGSGEKKVEGNAASNVPKLIKAYNDMVNINKDVIEYVENTDGFENDLIYNTEMVVYQNSLGL